MKILKRILTNDNRYTPENANYRKVYLLNAVLISFIIITLFFSFINIFSKRNLAIVLTQAGIAVIGALIMLFYRKTNNFLVASYSTLLLLLIFFSIFAIQVKNAYYSMAWIVIAPPIAFFLLGKKGGRNFSIVYILYFTVFIYIGVRQWDPADVTFSTILNLMGSVVSLVMLIGYYEKSKQSVTQGFIDKNTALNKANEQLSESKNRLQLILDSTAEALYGIDLEGRCTFCNQSCIRLLDY
ncbi:MAG: PAS domain-containing protein, partial [Clostridia bacterium]|nr:PAS domain-containing protein [Clostridia bacterium]